jgi:hypothetical protein
MQRAGRLYAGQNSHAGLKLMTEQKASKSNLNVWFFISHTKTQRHSAAEPQLKGELREGPPKMTNDKGTNDKGRTNSQ